MLVVVTDRRREQQNDLTPAGWGRLGLGWAFRTGQAN
jgi:hypothetical protein